MGKIKNSDDLLKKIDEYINKVLNKLDILKPVFIFGTIDPSYSSGRPKVKLDIDGVNASIRQKQYPYISSYTPVASDRVLLARTGENYVILGKII
jgi:hypothetical protein